MRYLTPLTSLLCLVLLLLSFCPIPPPPPLSTLFPYTTLFRSPTRVAEILKAPVFYPRMILEGGSIDVNGAGALLTSESCLLNKNRNPNFSRDEIEQRLRDYLGVGEIFWLGDGIEGDDTDGHIDDLARFVSKTKVVTGVEENSEDPNYKPLQENLERLRAMK